MIDQTAAEIDKLWDFNDPAATREKFQAALAQPRAATDESYRLQLLTQIARTYSLQGKFDESNATLDKVEQSGTPIVRVRYLLERGRAFNSAGQRDKARPLFVEAYELASKNNLDFYTIDAAHMLGIAEISEKQMEWHERALALAESSDDPRARQWAGSLYNNMGWTCFEAKQYDKALDLFRKGVDFRAANNQPRELRIAKYSVAKTLRMMRKIDEALEIDRAIYAEAQAAKDPDGYFCEELGECLIAKGQVEEARPYFKRAFELLSKDDSLVKHEPQRIKRLGELSKPSD